MIGAFGIIRFNGQKQKSPADALKEINEKLDQLQVESDNVINIQVDTDYYHVFYRK